MSDEVLRIAFLDVGQGDSTVIILPDGSTGIVVDCPRAALTIDFLEERGVTALSYIFLTHTDSDHIGGVVELLSNFRKSGNMDVISWNNDTHRVGGGNRRTILRRLLELREDYGLQLEEPRAGMQHTVQDLEIDILHPATGNLYGSQLDDFPNDVSVVLKLNFGKYRALLTGDIQARGWLWMMGRNTDLRADILKFPHHGAWYEPNAGQPSLPEVLSLIGPRIAIISVGSNNAYCHPHPNTVELLCSLPGVEFAHTQPTGRCYSIVETKRGPFSCSGTVEAVITKDNAKIIGENAVHLS